MRKLSFFLLILAGTMFMFSCVGSSDKKTSDGELANIYSLSGEAPLEFSEAIIGDVV